MVEVKAVPTSVGAQDQLFLHVSGVKPGSGRTTPTSIVNETFYLGRFLDEWGEGGGSAEAKFSHDELAALAATDKAAFLAEMAKITDALTGDDASKPLAERIIDAVCVYLSAPESEGGCGMLVQDSDPGNDVWYISRADLQPTVVQYPNDGYQWSILQVAPFG